MDGILEHIKRAVAALCRFGRAEDGSYMVYIGIAAIPMVAVAGMGVDIARAYLAEARLQSAIDSAAIAMGSADGTDDEIMTLGRTYFYANFPADFWAEPANLDITVTRVDPSDPTSRPESFAISASARVDTLFFRLLPYAGETSTPTATTQFDFVDVAAKSTALTEVKGLEVVMVLDVTGSMYSNYSGGERRIEAMRDAALKMVDILFQHEYEPELLRVGIVPYNTVVNIGTEMHSFVDNTGLDSMGNPTSPNPFGQTQWMGCVQARKNDNDLTDTYNATATDGTGRWPAYRWPIEPDRDGSTGYVYNSRCETIADNVTGDYRLYEDPLTDFEEDDPDSWMVYNSADPPVLVPSPVTRRYYDRDSDGPNKGCPGALLPLTNDRADVWNYLQDVTVVDGNGTITAAGLTWGWRVISPDPPFDQGREYNDIDWEKAIIVLTDGRQVLSQQNSSCDNADKVTNPNPGVGPPWLHWRFDPADYDMDGLQLGQGATASEQREGPDYRWSAYGYAHPNDSRPLGAGNIQTLLEDRFGEVCDAIKAVPDPVNGGSAIQIFSITFGDDITAGDSVSTMMADCTSDPLNNYFHAPGPAQLEAAFEEIARQLTSLRLAG